MPEASAPAAEGTPAVDWEAIERSPEFQELIASRKRFVVRALGFALVASVAYVLVSNLSPDTMGVSVFGEITLGFVAGVALIVMTWVITLMYLRRSDNEWAGLERRAVAHAQEPEGSGRDGQAER